MHHNPTRSPAADRHPTRHAEPPPRQPWSVLVLLSVAQFMVILDGTVVNIALPSIGRALHLATADLQWVTTAYVLLTGGLVLFGGRVSDLLPRRRVFLTGLGVFTAASLASGLAATGGVLIAARAAQGLGAALLTPAALSLITTTYTGAQRTAALSTWGAIGAAGAGAGVLAGGILTSWLGWRSVFLINVPVGVLTGLLSLRLLPSTPAGGHPRRQLDLLGALTVTAGLVALVAALAGTPEHGWGSARTLGLLALAGGLLAAFAVVERSARQPLLPPQTWRIRSLVAGGLVMLGASGILVGTFFLNTLYLQVVQGASALTAGLEFLPLVLAVGLASHLAARLLPHTGTRALAVAGLALMTTGALLLADLPAQASYLTDLMPGLLILGTGTGLVFPAASVTAMSDVAPEQAGLAAGLIMTAHEVGAALGVAVFSAVAAAAAGHTTVAGAGAGGFAAGYQQGFAVAAAIAAALAVAALLAVPPVRPAPGVKAMVH